VTLSKLLWRAYQACGPLDPVSPVAPYPRSRKKRPIHDESFGGFFEVRMTFEDGTEIFGDTIVKSLGARLYIENKPLTRITGHLESHPT
jgi:hypothetical protein